MAAFRLGSSTPRSGPEAREPVRLTSFYLYVALVLSLAGIGTAHGLPPLDCVIKPYVVVELGSPVEGVIQEITVERNDLVNKGQVLARLKSDVEKATVSLARARAELDGAIEARRAALEFGKRKLARTDELYEKKAVSFHIKDEAATDARIARLKLVEAKENKLLAKLELERAEELLNQRTIPSPIDGVVVERMMAPGEFIDDKPLLKLAQLNPLRVEVILPVTMYGSIHEGMRAVVDPELANSSRYLATVSSVDRVLDGSSGTFGARLILPNPDNALPGGLRCKLRPLREGEAPPSNVVDATAPTPLQESDVAPEPDTDSIAQAEPIQDPAMAHMAEPVTEPTVAEIAPPGSDVAVPEATESSLPTAGTETGQPVPDSAVAETVEPMPVEKPVRTVMIDVPTQPNAQVCGTIGPILTAGQANKLSKALASRVTQVNRRTDPPTRIARYLVVTPHQPSDEKARQVTAELQSAGHPHAFVMKRGSLKGHVSLGLFLKKANADKHRAELAAKGVESLIKTRYREQRQIWLDFEVPARDLDPVTRVVHNTQPGLSMAPADCPPLKTAQK